MLFSDESSTTGSSGFLLVMAVLALILVGFFVTHPKFLYDHRSLEKPATTRTLRMPVALR